MEPRALSRIMQLPTTRRLDVVAEGLELLAEHVATLHDDLLCLAAHERHRGLGVLTAHANEEAAKVLVLLDLVRMGWRDQPAANRQLSYVYSHLARSIYAEVAEMRPATFAEIKRMVDLYRESHYLDGPNDVDWIFRNQLLARREESIYVDYVHDEDGGRWTTPQRFDEMQWGAHAPVLDLVGSLKRLGLISRAGLDIIASAWRDHVVAVETHWVEVAAVNREITQAALDADLASEDPSDEDAGRVIDRWTFPLGALDLNELKIPRAELEAKRANWSPYD